MAALELNRHSWLQLPAMVLKLFAGGLLEQQKSLRN